MDRLPNPIEAWAKAILLLVFSIGYMMGLYIMDGRGPGERTLGAFVNGGTWIMIFIVAISIQIRR